MPEFKADDLMIALADERDAILSGSFEAMMQAIREKDAMWGRVDFSVLPQELKEVVLFQAQRNQKILSAAIKGMNNAIRKLGLGRDGSYSDSIYDALGEKVAVYDFVSNRSKVF